MSRRWHITHADGREWTQEELDALSVRMRMESRIAPYDEACQRVCVDDEGSVFILGAWNGWYMVDSDDVVVVWDE